MSDNIENKIVKISLDNSNYEKNATNTIKTSENLDKSLLFSNATKGFESINSASSKINLNNAVNNVSNLQMSFSAMEVVAITAISKITSAAMDMGTSIFKDFAITPITTGFSEYETQIGAVQTILANTSKEGTNLAQVNKALDELNLYADKTIYNFTEMTRNIGTFTAAGIELDTSVQAIKGIANLAAVSGSTSQQASTAMYQLSQALAAGRVSLMDWNSVVNAGMGGQLFQDQLIMVSEMMGTGAKAAIAEYGSFRESITKGEWITSEVLTETLALFTGDLSEAQLKAKGFTAQEIEDIRELGEMANDAATKVKTFSQLQDTLKESSQSGWTTTWELILGDFDEAKVLFTEMSNMFGGIITAFNDARNIPLADGLSSGYKKFMADNIIDESLFTDGFTKQVKLEIGDDEYNRLIKEFGSLDMAAQNGALAINDGMLKAGIDSINKHLATFKDEASKHDAGYTEEMLAGWTEFGLAIEADTTLLSGFADTMNVLSGRSHLVEGLLNIFRGLFSVLTPIGDAFTSIFTPTTGDQIYSFAENFQKLTSNLIISEEAASGISKVFSVLFTILKVITDIILNVGTAFFTVFGTVLGVVLKPIEIFFEYIAKISEGLNSLISRLFDFNTIAESFKNGVKAIGNSMQIWFDNNVDFEKIFGSMSDAMSKVSTFLGPFGDALVTFKDNILGAFGNGFSYITGQADTFINKFGEMEKFSAKSFFTGLIDSSKELFTNLTEVSKIKLDGLKGAAANAAEKLVGIFDKVKTGVSDAIDFLSSGFEKSVDSIGSAVSWAFNAIGVAIEYVTENFSELISLLTTVAIASFFVKITNILQDFAKPFEAFGDMFDDIGKLINEFTDIAQSVQGLMNAQKWVAYGTALKSFAIAIAILAVSLIALTFVDPQKLLIALGAIAGLALILGALMLVSKKATDLKGLGMLSLLLIAFSIAISVLASSIRKLQDAGIDDCIKLILIITTFVGAMVILVKKTNGMEKDLIKFSISMYLVAMSIGKLVEAMQEIAMMSLGSILASVLLLGVILVTLIGLTKLGGKELNKLGGTLTLLGVSIIIFAYALKTLSKVKLDTLESALPSLIIMIITIGVVFKLTQLTGKNAGNAISSLVQMSTALILLAVAFKILSWVDSGTIASAIASLTGITISLAIMLMVFGMISRSGNDIKKVTGSLLAVGVAFILIAIAMNLLAFMDKDAIIRATAAIVAIGLMLAVLMSSLKTVYNLHNACIGLAIMIAVLVAAIFALTLIDFNDALKSVAILSMVIILLSITLLFARDVTDQWLTVIMLGAVIAILTGSLMLLTLMDWQKLVASAVSLSLTITALAIAIKLLSNIKIGWAGLLQSVAAMALILLGVSAILWIVKLMDIGTTLPIALGLSVLLIALSGAMLLLSLVGTVALAAAGGLLALGAVVLGLLGMLLLIGWLYTENPWMGDAIISALDLFIIVAGKFGELIGAFAAGLMSTLPGIGESLGSFMTNLEPFIDGLKSIDVDILGVAVQLAAAIAALTASSVISGLADFFGLGDGIDGFANTLSQLAIGMRTFYEETSGIDDHERIYNLSEALLSLIQAMNEIETTGGWKGDIFGDVDIEAFVTSITSMAEMLTKISGEQFQIDANKIDTLSECIKTLNDAMSSLSKEGGIFDGIFGKFNAEGLKNDVNSLMDILNNVTLNGIIDEAPIDAFANSVDTLSKMTDNLSKSGGLSALISGEFDDEKFKDDIKSIISIMKLIDNDTDVIDLTKINSFRDAVDALSEIVQSLQNADTGILTLISTMTELTNSGDGSAVLSSGIETVAQALVKLSKLEIDTEKLLEIADTIITTLDSGLGSLDNKYLINDTLDDINDNIVDTLTPFEGSDYYNRLLAAGKTVVSKFAEGVSLNQNIATSAAGAMASATLEQIENTINKNVEAFNESSKNAGISLSSEIYNGVEDGIKTSGSSTLANLSKSLTNMASGINNDIDTSIVITPILDDSNITNGIKGITAELASIEANDIHARMTKQSNNDNDVYEKTSGSNETKQIIYNQNITSPKAVSRKEIYRQTNNLISKVR